MENGEKINEQEDLKQEMGNIQENSDLKNEFEIHAEDLAPKFIEEIADATEQSKVLNEEADEVEEEDFSNLGLNELLQNLGEAYADNDPETVKNRVRQLKEAFVTLSSLELEKKLAKFIEDGGIKEDFEPSPDPLVVQFNEIHKKFYQKLTDQRKQKEKTQRENYAKKQELIEELKELIERGENLNAAFEKFQEIQSKWRTIGQVPNNLTNTQWKDFQFHVSRFFDIVKISKELRELDLKKNLELKTELCEKAAALINDPSIKRSIHNYNALLEDWKNIGQVAKEGNETIWVKFRTAGENLYQRREKYLLEQKEKQGQNLIKKKEFIEEMSMILSTEKNSFSKWMESEKRVEEIMDAWKKTGFAPKKENDLVWEEFKALRKKHFVEKENFFASIKKEQNTNLKLKTQLCEEAEALKESQDWEIASRKIKDLQYKWKKTGPVPRKYSDKIWNRFREACNSFFENMRKNQQDKEQVLVGNISEKEEIINKIENYSPSENIDESIATLASLQNEFNSIQIPSAENSRINALYQKAINKVLDGFKGEETGSKYYELKYSLIKSTEKGIDFLVKERAILQDKIKNSENELNLLENNIGFFSKSKSSDKVLGDFKIKIEQLRKSIDKKKEQQKIIRNLLK